MAQIVGPTGSVVAVEVDENLAGTARSNLRDMSWVDVRHGDGTVVEPDSCDAILVNAGMTHPHERVASGATTRRSPASAAHVHARRRWERSAKASWRC